MRSDHDKAVAFRKMHEQATDSGTPAFVIPNPWDRGSARMLAGCGFQALATSSAGFAFTQGKCDGAIARSDALAHARAIADLVDVPISADLENGYGHSAAEVATTVTLAGETGIAGCSIEDATGNEDSPIYEKGLAVERIEAAVEAARALSFPFTLCARAENFLHGHPALDDTIDRLQAFDAAGADVLYAPGLPDIEAVRLVCASVSKPVNVLASGALARYSVAELSEAGAARISLGSVLARHAFGQLHLAAREMLDRGSFDFASNAGSFEQINQFMLKR